MSKVTSINSKREPILYSIHITSHFGGESEYRVEGIGDDDRSVAWMIVDLELLVKLLKENHLEATNEQT